MIVVNWIMGNIRLRICEMNRQDITTAGIVKKKKSLSCPTTFMKAQYKISEIPL